MNNTLTYKGYVGSIEFSEADSVFFAILRIIPNPTAVLLGNVRLLRARDDYAILSVLKQAENLQRREFRKRY